jgi:hypothetical protein
VTRIDTPYGAGAAFSGCRVALYSPVRLSTTGLRDESMRDVHLCNFRVQMLWLNMMPAETVAFPKIPRGVSLGSASRCTTLAARLASDWQKSEPGLRRISWYEATEHSQVAALNPKGIALS